MITVLAISYLFAALSAEPGERDSICRDSCEILAVQDGTVRFIDQWRHRNLPLGTYRPAAQRLVPRTEAPVLDVQSQRGWRVVGSAYLDHEQDDLLVNLRFFGPEGSPRGRGGVLFSVEQTSIGRLFGGSDEIFAITSNEEHSYNAQTEIWLLPEHGDARVLLEIGGVYKTFAGPA